MKPKKTDSLPDMPPESMVPCEACTPREGNRNLDGDTELADLAESLVVGGQLHPIHVRVLEKGRYEILAGVRRWKAAQQVGWKEIRAIVHEVCDDLRAEQIRLIENHQRREPTALDTARGLQRFKNRHACTNEQVAEHLGLPRTRVNLYLSLFNASDPVLKAIDACALPVSTAAELVRFEKAHGELAVRPLLRRLAAGELSRRDLEVLRKRKAGASKAKDEPTQQPRANPWPAITRRVEKLHSEDPAGALQHLEALCVRLRAASGTQGMTETK